MTGYALAVTAFLVAAILIGLESLRCRVDDHEIPEVA